MLLASFIIVPVAAGLICTVVRSARAMALIGLAALGTIVALALRLVYLVLARGVVTAWHEALMADALSAWMVVLVAIVSFGAMLSAPGYFQRDLAAGAVTPGRVREFFVLTPLFTAGMMLVVLVNNLGVMWFAVEATALSSVLLVALYNRPTSLEAAWKYIMLGSLGLALALLGTVLMYAAAIGPAASEHLPSFNWSHLMILAPQLDPRLVRLAFVLALIGYGTKAGLAPMHTWLPDAHSEAPSPTSAMLSGVSLKIALYALLRFHMLATACLHSDFSANLLLGFGLFSMLLAPPFILVQRNLKRMLAYSSLEHVGLICAGVGLNAPLAIFGALLHMGYHAVTKPVLFIAAGNIHQTFHTLELRRIGGVIRLLPVTGVLLALAAAAAAGLPPFGLFYSELTVLSGGLSAHHVGATALILIALVASFCGLLRQLTRVLLGKTTPDIAPRSRPRDALAAMALLVATLLVFSVWLPESVLTLLHTAAAAVGGNR